MDKKCWIIAGATSVIATAFAHLVAMQGHQLILLARDTEKLSAIQSDLCIRYNAVVDYVIFDAEKTDEHVSVAKKCLSIAQHPIDLLIAFGFMLPNDSADHTLNEVVNTIHINFTGAASVAYAFMPYFMDQKQGDIIVLGSVAGERGRPANFDYGAAKSGLATFCEGLRGVLLPYHVSVTLMKLGYIDTPMTHEKEKQFPAASPDDCAMACLNAIIHKKAVAYFPRYWRWIMLIVKILPRKLLYRITA